MAESLISTMAGDFDPSQFTDDYREAMQQLLEAKQSGGEVQQAPETADDGGAVVDLMSALRRSVERAGGSAPAAAADGDARDDADDAAPAKKTTARKAPAKKAGAAAAPAKKAAPKKAAAKADGEPAEKPAKRTSRARKTA